MLKEHDIPHRYRDYRDDPLSAAELRELLKKLGTDAVALLRKNALFSGTGEHVARLCGLLSVLQTCRLLGLAPYEYLVWMLPRTVTRGYKTDQLTPAAFKRLQADPEGFG